VLAGLGWVLPAMPLIRWMSVPGIRKLESEVRDQMTDDVASDL
jgi:hypothetical protein